MKFATLFSALAFAAITSPALCAPNPTTPFVLARPQPKHEQIIDYLTVINNAATDLKDGLDVALNTNTKERDVTKMGTEVPIINLSLATADAVEALQKKEVKIADYKVIYNSLNALNTTTTEVSSRIIKLNADFGKAEMVPLVTSVLGAFEYGFNELYKEIVKVSSSNVPAVGKSKSSLPAVVSNIICTLNTVIYILDPSMTITDTRFCDKAGQDDWATLPITIPGQESCVSTDTRLVVCSLMENQAFDITSRKGAWCKCSLPPNEWGVSKKVV